MKAVRGGFIVGLLALMATAAWAHEPLAVLTEIQLKHGKVEVKAAGQPDWQPPKPLLSLRAGDQVRVTGDGRAVLVFTGGRGSQLVTQSNSPFTVQAGPTEGTVDRAKAVLGNVTNFLLGAQRERVLPGAVTFEWAGSDRLKYQVRLLGPQGVVWEKAELNRAPLAYPSSGPTLAPGARYTWELTTKDHGVQRASFDVLPAADATRIKDGLAVLAPGAAGNYPPATLALMRAGFLFQESLYADARQDLVRAIGTSPEEATLHLLLGHVYDRTGLKQLAAAEFDEAEALSAPRP
jgi:hypothetical protein